MEWGEVEVGVERWWVRGGVGLMVEHGERGIPDFNTRTEVLSVRTRRATQHVARGTQQAWWRSCLISSSVVSRRATWWSSFLRLCPTSQDQLFMAALSRTPEPLRRALQQRGLASAGVLRNYKRGSAVALKLGYEDKGTASQQRVLRRLWVVRLWVVRPAYFPPLHSYLSQPVVAPSVSVSLDPKVCCEVGVGSSIVGTDVAERLDDGSLSLAQRADSAMDPGKGQTLKRKFISKNSSPGKAVQVKPASQVSKKLASGLFDLTDDLPEGSFSLRWPGASWRGPGTPRSGLPCLFPMCSFLMLSYRLTAYPTLLFPMRTPSLTLKKQRDWSRASRVCQAPLVQKSLRDCRVIQHTKKFTHLETIIPGHDPSSSSASLSARLVSVPYELAPTISQDLDRIPCLAEAATCHSENPEVSLLGIVGTVKDTSREMCDGQSLASPGRWPISARRYPSSSCWKAVSSLYMDFADEQGSPDLLSQFALGKVLLCPFSPEDIESLKQRVIDSLKGGGYELSRTAEDRTDTPIDFRFLQLLLDASEDPDVALGSFFLRRSRWAGARLPRLPALYAPKRRWRLPQQADPLDYAEDKAQGEGIWRRNYTSLAGLSDKVLEVLHDQASRDKSSSTRKRRQRSFTLG